MPTNDYAIGEFYVQPNGPNGIWTQPGGPGTIVYPRQVQASSNLFSVEPFSELTGMFIGSCGHSFDSITLYRSYDYVGQTSVALICCPLCSVLFRVIAPFEAAVMGNEGNLQNAILFP